MKKTNCIQLVLITAALAGCDRPLYQQGSDYPGAYDRGPYYPGGAYAGRAYPGPSYPVTMGSGAPNAYPMGDSPDSSNSCPLERSQLPPDYYIWYSGLQPSDFYFGDGFNLEGYYTYRYPRTIVRAGFGHTGHSRIGNTAHS